MSKRIFLFIVLISIPVVLPFFRTGFFKTHDIIYLARIQTAYRALSDHQFPIRWISDFRYGEPLFNYYAPLPYYAGALIHSLGFDYISTSKILFISSVLLSGFFIYFLGNELWGKSGGLISAILYLYAPYRATDIYLRGALSEAFSFVWFPLIFWAFLKYYRTNKMQFLALSAVSLALLIITHNISALIFLPFLCLFLIILVLLKKSIYFVIKITFSVFYGLALSAFYWLPALIEKRYVQSESAILKFDYFVNQFVKIPEFLIPNSSVSVISHDLGPVAILLGLFSIIILVKIRNNRKIVLLIIFFLLLLFLSLYMQTIYSLFVWTLFPFLEYIQFPWRFAGLSVFFLAILGSSISSFTKNQLIRLFTIIIIFFSVLSFQLYHFQPDNHNHQASDKDYLFLNEEYLPKEYLPVGVKEKPLSPIIEPIFSDSPSKIEVSDIIKKSNLYQFSINLDKPKNVIVPVYYFPGWKRCEKSNCYEVKKQIQTGLISLDLPVGNNTVILRFTNTPVRVFANALSLSSISILILIFLLKGINGKVEKS